jgi:hypothetical protein
MYAWLEEGRALGAAYAQWKASIAETSRTRLLMIGEAATVHIARAVKRGDVKAALAVAKGMGLLAPPAVGPSIHEVTARKREAEAAKAEAEREEGVSQTAAFAELVDVEGIVEEVDGVEDDEGDAEGGGDGNRKSEARAVEPAQPVNPNE